MPNNYTFRIHKFIQEDGESYDYEKNNQYIIEVVESDSVDTAYSAMVAKYGNETQARIILKKVN